MREAVFESNNEADSQSGYHQSVFKLTSEAGTTEMIWIKIKRDDSYAFQSHATAYIWSYSQSEWKEIAMLYYSEMKTEYDYLKGKKKLYHYMEDEVELLHRAELVLQFKSV